MLQNPVSLDELCSSFPNVPRESIANLMRNLQQYQIVEAVSDDSVLPMNVAVLGLGSLGSHIVQQISMLGLCSLTLIDDDIVEYDNIYRQIYTLADVGKTKSSVLAHRESRVPIRNPVEQKVTSADDLIAILQEYSCNLVIQAADEPSAGEVAEYVWVAADQLNIPYITIPGYVGNVVGFPEFYYPRQIYRHTYQREYTTDNLLFMHSLQKIPFRTCSILGATVARQIDDYMHEHTPYGYGHRGFFHENEERWQTRRIFE
ncbi:MAG: ThiF family adenylyltransferase [Bifidobacterium animalis]|nr:ThiF family adenylyltransferase [Bifidobacterium animalis]MDY5039822.1 ThiF family adenylyltransferase [Bifidobacterium animalis]